MQLAIWLHAKDEETCYQQIEMQKFHTCVTGEL